MRGAPQPRRPRFDVDECPSCHGPKMKKATFCRRCSPLTRDSFHPFWRGDLATKNVKRKRAERRYEMGPCERCGQPGHDRHHLDGDPGNNRPDNVEILCRSCHMQADGRMDQLLAAGRRIHQRARERTHCKNGHPLTPENTYIPPSRPTRRVCRQCHREEQARRTEEKREREGWVRRRAAKGAPECGNGHLFTEANTYIRPNGQRSCRMCHADAEARRRARVRFHMETHDMT